MINIKKFFTARYDQAFKSVFLTDDKRLLEEFLRRILKEDIEVISYPRCELINYSYMDKTRIVDVLVKSKYKYIHIEINNGIKEYTNIRNFSYFSRIYESNVKKGKDYDLDTEYIHIDITYGMKDKEDYRVYYVQDDLHKHYIENIKIMEFNMDKLMKYWYNLDKIKFNEYKHLIMLDMDDDSLEKVEGNDWLVNEYKDKIETLNDNEEWSYLMTYEEDKKLCYNTDLKIEHEKGLQKGLQEGHKEGSKEKTYEIAKNMLRENIDLDVIKKCTGLSKEEIQKLII